MYCTQYQFPVTTHVDRTRIRKSQQIPGMYTRCRLEIKEAHPLAHVYGFALCLQLLRHPRQRGKNAVAIQFPTQRLSNDKSFKRDLPFLQRPELLPYKRQYLREKIE